MVPRPGSPPQSTPSQVRRKRRATILAAAILLLTIHATLLAWEALRQGPAWDEVGHVAAGLSHWMRGEFGSYRVNPPLARMVAVLPVLAAGVQMDWTRFGNAPPSRMEFSAGRDLALANGPRSFWLFTLARWACIPFSLVGGLVCLVWARKLYGDAAGLVALALWCFSPSLLGFGGLVGPDVAAAALGTVAGYAFWCWLKTPHWMRAVLAGVALGLAELTKMTWIVLFFLWPVLWLLYRGPRPNRQPLTEWCRQGRQLLAAFLLALCLINLGYGCEDSFQPLGEYRFFSGLLTGRPPAEGLVPRPGNRFADTWLAALPVPLPGNYVLGIDVQRSEFDRKLWSYLRGEWRFGGWWYYYLYGMAVKEPLGTWGVVLLAVSLTVGCRGCSASWRDELLLVAPAVVVLVLVSAHTGFNHHLRYVFPMYPFAFIWSSKIALASKFRCFKTAAAGKLALGWAIASSLWVFPHNQSYFNELVGGPANGHYHMHASNTDWGQDLLYLKRWLDEHPEAKPLSLALWMPLIDPALAGIDHVGPPPQNAPRPGWHAISVNEIHADGGGYLYFLQLRPVASAGYSILIYHVTLEEARRLRRQLGVFRPSDVP